MNASSILKYFLKKGFVRIDKKQVLKIAKSVGQDVVLGLNSSHTILNSKNEVKQFQGYQNFYTLIVKPKFGCTTKEIYSKVGNLKKED